MIDALKTLHKGHFNNACYRDTGAGFPVMLVHGFPVDGSLWNYQAAALKKNFRLLIPDLPGSGRSPLHGPISIEDMADFLYDILEQEQLTQCIIIGHSMGGYATLAFAEKHPDRLKGFGLFHSSAFADTAEKKEGRLRSIGMMKQYGAGAFLRQMLPGLFAATYRQHHKEALQALIKSKEGADVDALTAYYTAMMNRPDRTMVLRQAKVPVLFIIGKEDTAAPETDVMQQVSLPATSDVHVLPEVAHMGMLEIPEASVKMMEEFIHLCLQAT